MAVRANLAINGWNVLKQGYKNIGYNLRDTWQANAPLTYAFRTAEARQAFRDSVQKHGIEKAIQMHKENGWGKDSLSWKRIGIIGGTAYAGTDMMYRALSGGSLYRNKDGERDFVGIPML